jgi:virginiamycin B lyase
MKRYLGFALFSALIMTGCSGSGGISAPFAATVSVPTVASTITAGITANSALSEAVSGPDGRIWFTEFNNSANNLAAVTTAGVVTEYHLTGLNFQPNGIVVGPDGNIWTGGYGGLIDKVTTGGVATQYTVAAGAHITTMVVGSDSNIWYGDYGNSKVGKITTAGVVTEYPLPAGSIPCGIAAGSDGNLWLTDCGLGFIRKISTAGTVLNSYSAGLSHPTGVFEIIGGPDGNLYFTENNGNAAIMDGVGKITTAGTITELGTLTPLTAPQVLAIGKDGNVYFTELLKKNLGRIFLSNGAVSEFPLVLSGSNGTTAIAAGPDGRLWLSGFQTIYAVTY